MKYAALDDWLAERTVQRFVNCLTGSSGENR